MFGPEVLVAPVIEAGARSRSVYLHGGAYLDQRLHPAKPTRVARRLLLRLRSTSFPSSPATTTAVNSENILGRCEPLKSSVEIRTGPGAAGVSCTESD